jgi:hypothetical protein
MIKELNVTPNKNIVKINYTISNDGISSVSGNVTVENLAVITKMLNYFKIKIPENENDKSYQKEFLKTVIDAEKALNGVQSNILVSNLVHSFLKSGEQEIKFPIAKVSAIIRN